MIFKLYLSSLHVDDLAEATLYPKVSSAMLYGIMGVSTNLHFCIFKLPGHQLVSVRFRKVEI